MLLRPSASTDAHEDGAAAARDVLTLAGVPSSTRGWLAEMLLGVRDTTVDGERYFEPTDKPAAAGTRPAAPAWCG